MDSLETVLAVLLIVVALGLAAKTGNRRRRKSYVSFSSSNDDVTILGAGDSISHPHDHHQIDHQIGHHH
jgi:hypothetical protein